MNASLRSRSPFSRLVASSIVAFAALAVVAPAGAAMTPQAAAPHAATVLTQGVCRVGDYASHDYAIAVRNNLQSRGYQAWVEHHGSLYSGTRTYVVFARC